MVKPISNSTIIQYVFEMNQICQKHSVNIQFTEADWMNSLIDNTWSYKDNSNHPIKQQNYSPNPPHY